MAEFQFDLYLDESGNFETDGKPSARISIVGGLLIPSGRRTNRLVNELVGNSIIHAMENYDHGAYPDILKRLHNADGKFVVFENRERISALEGDLVYLNVLSEGVVRLMRKLKLEHPEDTIRLNVLIAYRQAASYKRNENIDDTRSIRISIERYTSRIREKIYIAQGREKVTGVDWKISFESANTDCRLMLADLICFSYRFREERGIFCDEERELFARLFDSSYVYSVFEDATTTYLDNLLLERHYGESIFQICALPQLGNFARKRDELLNALKKADRYELEAWLAHMSLRIGQLNRLRRFDEGIKLAQNYKKRFLSKLVLDDETKNVAAYWLFDTDFFLATMYDHLGNIPKCNESLRECEANIDCVIRSWEHIDYYFRFRIRKLNALMNSYAFDEIIKSSKQLEKTLEEATELFGMIETYEGKEMHLRSELLGRVYGIQLMAYVNLLHSNPEYLQTAIELSDKALSHFDDSRDISRQQQYRCLLHVEARQPGKALVWLAKSLGLEGKKVQVKKLVEAIIELKPHMRTYPLWHYTNVMLAFQDKGDSRAEEMAKTLMGNPMLKDSLASDQRAEHPVNMTLWNIARYACATRDIETAKYYYNQSLDITLRHHDHATMQSLALSMSAAWLLWLRNNKMGSKKDRKDAERKYAKIIAKMQKEELPISMCHAFKLDKLDANDVSDDVLHTISDGYLR